MTASIGTFTTVALAGCTGETEPADTASGGNSNDDGTPTAESTPTGGSSTTDAGDNSGTEIEILEHSLAEGDISTSVKGKMKNVSGSELGYMQVAAKFFNADDERIGEGIDNATDVSDGTVVNFECLFAGDGEIDTYELEASTSPA